MNRRTAQEVAAQAQARTVVRSEVFEYTDRDALAGKHLYTVGAVPADAKFERLSYTGGMFDRTHIYEATWTATVPGPTIWRHITDRPRRWRVQPKTRRKPCAK